MSHPRWSTRVVVLVMMSLAGTLGASEEIRLGDTVLVRSEETVLRRGLEVVATVSQGRRLKVLMLKDLWVGTAVVSEGQLVGGWILKREVELVRKVADEPSSAPKPRPVHPAEARPRIRLLPANEFGPEAKSPAIRWTHPFVDCVKRFEHWLKGSTPSRPPLPAVIPEPLEEPMPPDPVVRAGLEPKWGEPYETDLPPARAPRAAAKRAFELPDFPLPIPRR